jgi:hypothetical protein
MSLKARIHRVDGDILAQSGVGGRGRKQVSMAVGLPDSLIFNSGLSLQFHGHVFPGEVFPVRQVKAITMDLMGPLHYYGSKHF